MSLFDWFEKIRQKPESARRRAAFLISVLLITFVFVVWLSFRLVSLPETNHQSEQKDPFSILVDMFKDF